MPSDDDNEFEVAGANERVDVGVRPPISARSASFFACTLRKLFAELTDRMSGRPSLRMRIPSEFRVGFVRVFLPPDVPLVVAVAAAAVVVLVVIPPPPGAAAAATSMEGGKWSRCV